MSSNVLSMELKDDHPSLMTLGEVMNYLRVNARTVYRLINTGGLPAYRVGRQWRIRRADFQSWLDSHRVTTPLSRSTAGQFPGSDVEPTSTGQAVTGVDEDARVGTPSALGTGVTQ